MVKRTTEDKNPIVITDKTGEKLELSGELKDAIFSKKLLPLKLPKEFNSSKPDPISESVDPYNSYELNNYNFRGNDFQPGVDILAAGCSTTFGLGVPNDGTWPSIVGEKTGFSVANLSAPGASIEWIVNSIYSYIYTFGLPNKYIIVYFPDILRGEAFIDEEVTTSMEVGPNDFYQQSMDSKWKKKIITHSSLDQTSEAFPAPKVIRKPYPVEYVKSKYEALRQSLTAIKNLEMYCEQLGITLIWSSWSSDIVELMKNIPEEYEYRFYINMIRMGHWKSHFYELEKTKDDPEGIVDYKLDHRPETLDFYECSDELEGQENCKCFSKCHFHLESRYGSSFHDGTDRHVVGALNSHIGVHKHIHVAESFVEHMINEGLEGLDDAIFR